LASFFENGSFVFRPANSSAPTKEVSDPALDDRGFDKETSSSGGKVSLTQAVSIPQKLVWRSGSPFF